MLTDEQIQDSAAALHAASRSGRPIRQLTLQYPDMNLDDAYAVQSRWIDIRLAEGRKVSGHKIGLTSRAMQQAVQIDEPDYGTLLDDMFFADGSEISASRFLAPMIEVELSFVLKNRLFGEQVGLLDVMSATEYVIPALELIDARSYRRDPATGRPRKVIDTIADNAASAGVIMGGRPVRPFDIDLRWAAAILYRNGIIEETGVAAGVLNHPANGIAWLGKKFFPRGVALEAGEVILAGSFTRPVAVHPGDTFHVDYGTLGAISCHFS